MLMLMLISLGCTSISDSPLYISQIWSAGHLLEDTCVILYVPIYITSAWRLGQLKWLAVVPIFSLLCLCLPVANKLLNINMSKNEKTTKLLTSLLQLISSHLAFTLIRSYSC